MNCWVVLAFSVLTQSSARAPWMSSSHKNGSSVACVSLEAGWGFWLSARVVFMPTSVTPSASVSQTDFIVCPSYAVIERKTWREQALSTEPNCRRAPLPVTKVRVSYPTRPQKIPPKRDFLTTR
jgi:hypothetical protein